MKLLGPLLEAGWTLNDIREHSIDDLAVASALLSRLRILRNPISQEEAGKIVSEHPEMVDAVNRSIEEQRKVFG